MDWGSAWKNVFRLMSIYVHFTLQLLRLLTGLYNNLFVKFEVQSKQLLKNLICRNGSDYGIVRWYTYAYVHYFDKIRTKFINRKLASLLTKSK
jgi:hypothetical protein